MSSILVLLRLTLLLFFGTITLAKLNASEIEGFLVLSNDRLYTVVDKSRGVVTSLFLDGQNLLGLGSFEEPTPGGSTGNGYTGIGPYLDCYCVPSGSYTPGSIAPYYRLLKGHDSSGTAWGGIVMGEKYPPTGQVLEQYWFLRDGETGLHTFSRLAYYNETTPFLRNLQEFRTLFRPNTPLWTHLSTNEEIYAPLPNLTNVTTVQDATWYVRNRSDPYVIQFSDYFTKYTFQDTWRDHKVHGMFADGTRSQDGSTFGAWLVMNTVDTYFGGPLHSDLMVDGIVYNYMGMWAGFLCIRWLTD
jgi:rhamnogalacturonan endolyase